MSKTKVRFKNSGDEKSPKNSDSSSDLTSRLSEFESEKEHLLILVHEQEDFIKKIAENMSRVFFDDYQTKYSDREIIEFGTQLLSSIPDKEIDSLLKSNNLKNDDKENKSDLRRHSNIQDRENFTLAIDGVSEKIYANVVDKKLPGQSSIRVLKHDMLTHICQVLDVEKKSGADWRCLALRTGIDDAFIRETTNESCSPTLQLLKKLSNDPLFSVRLLHRHFISPQMKQFELARVLESHFDL